MLEFLLLILGVILLALGIILTYRESSRRLGDDPHCRKCGYLLHGLESQRCPECGATLSPEAIARGARGRDGRLCVRNGCSLSFSELS